MYKAELLVLGIVLVLAGMVPGVILDVDGIWLWAGILAQIGGIVVLLTYVRLAVRSRGSSDTISD
jgi:hypothetical protein